MISTKKIPLEERRELWKFMHARHTFEQAEMIVKLLKKEKISDGNALYYPLLVALVVLYGRPFKQKELRLSADILPEHLRLTHKGLLEARDKIYAHADLDGLQIFGGGDVNQIAIRVKGNHADLFFCTVAMNSEALNRVDSLLLHLLEKTKYHLDKIWKKYAPSINVPDGEYRVNLSEGEDTLLTSL